MLRVLRYVGALDILSISIFPVRFCFPTVENGTSTWYYLVPTTDSLFLRRPSGQWILKRTWIYIATSLAFLIEWYYLDAYRIFDGVSIHQLQIIVIAVGGGRATCGRLP